ncbi:hypothetical protein C0995_009090 [Termitomyces sp. Mi166|nr:hypothetical protein C0995_009090 [Termitomyces sp. Mi166\
MIMRLLGSGLAVGILTGTFVTVAAVWVYNSTNTRTKRTGPIFSTVHDEHEDSEADLVSIQDEEKQSEGTTDSSDETKVDDSGDESEAERRVACWPVGHVSKKSDLQGSKDSIKNVLEHPSVVEPPNLDHRPELQVDVSPEVPSKTVEACQSISSSTFATPSICYPSIDENKRITLTFRSDPYNVAERHYDKVCFELATFPLKDSVKITAKMISDENWSEDGLQTLGQSLARLSKADIGKLHRCNWLSVDLPKTRRLPLGTAPDTSLALPELKRLFWRSHRNQLPLLRPEISLGNITSLTLRCNISTRDCAFLLLKGAQTLTTVNVWTVFDDETRSVLPDPGLNSSELVTMVSLTFLTIASACDISPLLNHFDFPGLKKINFDISDYIPHFAEDFKTIVWENLQETWLKCDFSRDDPKWIEAQVEKANPRVYCCHVHRHYPVELRSRLSIMD